MKSIGITGGIGSGKSYVCHTLEAQGHPVFYCDAVAKRLMNEDPQLQAEITSLTGEYSKEAIRRFLTKSSDNAAKINALVHPRVVEAWKEFLQEHSESPLVIMECALLFESGLDAFVDESWLITADTETRLQRVAKRDGRTREDILKMMALQMPEEEKMRRATRIYINNVEGQPFSPTHFTH